MTCADTPSSRFMPADAFWTLTMAINVWLTFYQKFDAPRLRKMEVYYWTFCYGVPFIPALAFLFIRNGDGVRVYGDAILWCWISQDWAIWRIILFYAPVWYDSTAQHICPHQRQAQPRTFEEELLILTL